MLEKDKLFNVLLAAFYTLTIPSLAALGEQRIDAYFSLMTLEYAILYAVLRPRRRGREVLLPLLIVIFAYFV
ncbi:MAG: hypothetical protein NZ954_03590, partial [Thermofilaceae archaeon]|nr:hypothetical protein [Thermofilaceae archaeon]